MSRMFLRLLAALGCIVALTVLAGSRWMGVLPILGLAAAGVAFGVVRCQDGRGARLEARYPDRVRLYLAEEGGVLGRIVRLRHVNGERPVYAYDRGILYALVPRGTVEVSCNYIGQTGTATEYADRDLTVSFVALWGRDYRLETMVTPNRRVSYRVITIDPRRQYGEAWRQSRRFWRVLPLGLLAVTPLFLWVYGLPDSGPPAEPRLLEADVVGRQGASFLAGDHFVWEDALYFSVPGAGGDRHYRYRPGEAAATQLAWNDALSQRMDMVNLYQGELYTVTRSAPGEDTVRLVRLDDSFEIVETVAELTLKRGETCGGLLMAGDHAYFTVGRNAGGDGAYPPTWSVAQVPLEGGRRRDSGWVAENTMRLAYSEGYLYYIHGAYRQLARFVPGQAQDSHEDCETKLTCDIRDGAVISSNLQGTFRTPLGEWDNRESLFTVYEETRQQYLFEDAEHYYILREFRGVWGADDRDVVLRVRKRAAAGRTETLYRGWLDAFYPMGDSCLLRVRTQEEKEPRYVVIQSGQASVYTEAEFLRGGQAKER